MRLGRLFLLLLTIQASLTVAEVQAGSLALSDYRIVLNGRDRAHSLTVTNRGPVTTSYRLSLAEVDYRPDGSVMYVAPDAARWPIESPYLRIAPRGEITLAPGESQHIRIAAALSPGLAPGEYRSHLRLSERTDGAGAAPSNPSGKGLIIETELSLSIPILVRHRTEASRAILEAPAFSPADGSSPPRLSVTIRRSGLESLYGTVRITNAQGQVLGVAPGVAVHTSVEGRHLTVDLRSVLPSTAPLSIEFLDDESGEIKAHITYEPPRIRP